ncbi:Armadillo segment polarity protein [Echinococcus granulosus]|uniref:Armadillo segment polarity protein n=1 Tax=Echinococcus granulosus TaxID=6210 RepID=A0A068X1S8_ECHGR|nr:Armadillo segment polarity protein [Echinococcus granulosus]CDS24739.1 armadillo segment polarity protein [Echinococcus granulosus]
MRPSQSKESAPFSSSTCASQNSLFLSDNALSLSRSLQSLGGLGKPISAVQRLSPCVESLTKAIGMIVNFKDDAFAAAANVPKLTRLLDPNLSTPENHYNACVILHKLSEKEASRNSLAYHPQIIESLVHLLQTTQDINTQTEAVLALRKLCYAKPALSAVRSVLSVHNLVELLSHPTESIFLTALSILHRQMLFLPHTTRPEVKDCGGPIQLASLFTPEKIADPAWLTVCADAIRMTAYEDAETKLILLDCDIAEKIVYLLNMGPKNEKLQHALARLVKVLSASTECKQGLVEAGAVQALTQLLYSKHNSLVLETLWGLRNLSDQAFHLTDTRGLLKLLVPLVSSSVEHISICSIGCLCNLTCQNATNKATLIEIDGVRALCGCLTAFLNRDEVTEPICSALRNLTHQNEHASLAVRQIHDFGVLKTIAGLLKSDQFPEQLPLVKAVIGLIRNLGLSKSCRRNLHQLGTTDSLIALFQRATSAYEDAVRQRSSILSDASELSYIEGVRLEDLVELLLVALQSMAQHSSARMTIIEAPEGVLASFVQYLYSSSEFLQRASLSLLNEISVCPEGSQAIEHEGAIARITELVHSSDPKTATYSASILHRAAAHLKSVDYQLRLSQELKKSLRDSGVLPAQGTLSEAPSIDRLPNIPEERIPKPRPRNNLDVDKYEFEGGGSYY